MDTPVVYMPVATTGNLMRLVEAGYGGFVDNDGNSRKAFRAYAVLIGAFVVGAIAGALATERWGVHAIWIAAACLAVALILLLIDKREGKVV
jgi:uncharacterized membrane protein YoaK (UPF0700 family)